MDTPTLLARLAVQPLLRVSDCSPLTFAEEEQLCKMESNWEKCGEDYVCMNSSSVVQEHPDATAITFKGSD